MNGATPQRRPVRRRGATGARALLAAASLTGLALAPSARADGSEQALLNAQRSLTVVAKEAPNLQREIDKAKAAMLTVEERLANGEILYRSKDYGRAGVVFSEILEQYPDTPSYPDALFLRGQTYFDAHEYLSARRDFREIVQHASEPRYQSYLSPALARLVDVAIRVNDLSGLDEVFARMSQVPPAQVDAGLVYAKGKAHYAKKSYGEASAAFAAIPLKTPFTHQARYFQALIAMKQARPAATPLGPDQLPPPASSATYKQAIEGFRVVTELPPDSDEHQHVIDLAWLAIGRLFYEMEQYQQASEAYSKVGRDSPEFDTMLFELAWVYVRLGDVQRAERALEVLSIADPNSQFIGEGTLLRADLLLRAGAFDKALQLYEQVRREYEPMRVKVEDFIDSTKDLGAYYEKLSDQQMEALATSDQLPPVAIRWAREAEDGPAAFAVIDDVNQCKTLIHQSERLIEKLNALLSASNRVRAFPDLLAGETKAIGLINQIAKARLELARGMDSEEPGDLSGDIGATRQQRRQLMGVLAGVPVTQADFDERDRQGTAQWNTVSQELSRRSIEIDSLKATINGLRRVLREDAQRGVARDPASTQRFQAELDDNEHQLKVFQEMAGELRRLIEVGRAQIGLGDSRYQNDAAVRQQFRDVFDREVQLAGAGQAGATAQGYAQRIAPVLSQARAEEDQLAAAFAALDAQVAARTTELRAKIDAEAQNLQRYGVTLNTYDGEARDLVGHVAERNFRIVRDKLRNIVLRADVGITEQAWEVREEELDRVHNLQGERAREEQILDEELREVLDDSDSSQPTPPAGGAK